MGTLFKVDGTTGDLTSAGDVTVAASKKIGLDGPSGHIFLTRDPSVGDAIIMSSDVSGDVLLGTQLIDNAVFQVVKENSATSGAQIELDKGDFFLQLGALSGLVGNGKFYFKDNSFNTLMILDDVGTLILTKAPVLPTVDYTASTASPVTPNGLLVSVYNVTVDANLTINGFSNPYSGQKILLQLHNDASHVVTFATGANNFRFGTDIPSYTGTPSKTDYVGVVWNSADTVWDIVSLSQGF